MLIRNSRRRVKNLCLNQMPVKPIEVRANILKSMEFEWQDQPETTVQSSLYSVSANRKLILFLQVAKNNAMSERNLCFTIENKQEEHEKARREKQAKERNAVSGGWEWPVQESCFYHTLESSCCTWNNCFLRWENLLR